MSHKERSQSRVIHASSLNVMCCAAFRARETASGKILALKKIKMEREKEGFPLTSIREINILLALHHKNIVNVTEVPLSPFARQSPPHNVLCWPAAVPILPVSNSYFAMHPNVY